MDLIFIHTTIFIFVMLLICALVQTFGAPYSDIHITNPWVFTPGILHKFKEYLRHEGISGLIVILDCADNYKLVVYTADSKRLVARLGVNEFYTI